MFVWKAKVLLL